jgi:hypothetical protein
LKLTDAESRSLTEVLKENTRLAADLAQAQTRVAELAAMRPATLRQRVQNLEAALREVQRQYQTHCEVFLGEEIQERIDALLTPLETKDE